MNKLTSLKPFLFFLFSMVFILSLNWGLKIISYEPVALIHLGLWGVFYPIAVIMLFYFIYLKTNSWFARQLMETALLQQAKSEWKIKAYKVVVILFFPVLINYTVIAYLALASRYLASQSFSELVSVKEARCVGRLKTDLKLTVINVKENQEHTIRFYHDCILEPESLYYESIKVYGHQWLLGKVYEGYI